MKNIHLFALAALVALPLFAEDPYIESDGTTGINTGYRVKPTSRIEVDFALPTAVQTSGARLFGADYNTTTLKIAFSLYISANNGNPCWVVGFGSAASGWTGGWPKDSGGNFLYLDTARHTMVYDFAGDRHTYYTDGTAIAWQTDEKTYSEEATQPFAIFAAKNASGFEKPATARIYGVKIYEKEGNEYVLVHNFVPCVATGHPGFRDDVAVPGFKDAVTGEFIGNNDAPTAFSAGGDYLVENPAYVATPDTDWTAAAQYIDSLYFATDQTRCEIDYSLLATPSASAWLFSGYGNATYGIYVKSGGSTFGMDNGGGWSNDPSVSGAGTLNVRRTVVLDFPNNQLHLVSGNTTNASVSAKALAGKRFNSNTIKIAGRFNGGSEFAPIKIYGFRIFEASVLTRDFVPCLRDGVPGLRDTMTGLFVSYPGTLGTKLAYGGTGIAVEANPYIETDKNYQQYLNTGYMPINTTRFELDYALMATRPSGTWVLFRGNNSAYFGAYNNGSGFGFINGNGWKSGVSTTTLADATGIRRTAILDNVADLATLVTAGVTNGSMSCTDKLPATAGGTAVTLSESEGFSASEYSSLRIYACRIFENGVAVHEFLPAVQDGVPGLQDQLSSVFIPVLSKGSTNPYVYGGVFPAAISAPSPHVPWGQTLVLTASAPGAVSYRWLCNGEEIEGGTDGHLTVAWRKCREERDSFQAVAVFSVDGMTVEGEPTAPFSVEYGRRGFVMIVK